MLREYLRVLCNDWVAAMSGLGSVVLAFWVTYWPPALPESKALLWLSAFICFLIASYRVWLRERKNSDMKLAELRAQLDQALTKPLFMGAIEKQQGGPIHTLSGGLKGCFSGCGVAIIVHFVNNRPIPTSIVGLRLRLRVGEQTHDAVLTEARSGYKLIFSDFYGQEHLDKRLGEVATQGNFFTGYLQFTLRDVLIKLSDEVKIECLLIEDTLNKPIRSSQRKTA